MIVQIAFGDRSATEREATALMSSSEAWQYDIGRHIWHFLDHPDRSYVFRTSGSTGTPKEMAFEHLDILYSAKRTIAHLQLHHAQKALLVLPAAFVGGRMMLYRAMMAGWTLDCIPPQISWMPQGESYDFCAMTPAQYTHYLSNPRSTVIDKILLGGASVSANLKAAIPGHQKIWESYGMTETLSHVALRDLQSGSDHFTGLSGVGFRQNEEQCLIIEDQRFGSIETNDVVELLDTNSFRLLGRKDHVINSGGLKLHPSQIEHKLRPHMSQEFMIGKVPDPLFGERPALFVTNHENDIPFAEIFDSNLPKIQRPVAVYQVKFHYTENQKLQRSKTSADLSHQIWPE